MAKTLNVIESAWRATLEEQDDTIVWLTHALRGAGADVDVLLRGNAVAYATKGQAVDPITMGTRTNAHAPDLEGDIAALLEKGATVYFVQDDVAERGLEGTDLMTGLKGISRAGIADLFDSYDRVWHW